MARAHAIRAPARARRSPRRRSALLIWRRRVVAVSVLAIALASGYKLWLRDSSLVAVNRVTITGAQGPQAAGIRNALADAAGRMTTLHLRQDELDAAARPYPIVKAVKAEPSFPHGLAIRVTLQRPALVVVAGGQRIAVAGDGTLLRGVSTSGELPVLNLAQRPPGARLQAEALQEALVLAATPAQLRSYLSGTSILAGGVRVKLRGAPELRFGDGSIAGAKWAAAASMLASRGVRAAGYVDISAPGRPAVGGIVQTPSTGVAGATGATG